MSEWRNRVHDNACPAQRRLLKKFGDVAKTSSTSISAPVGATEELSSGKGELALPVKETQGGLSERAGVPSCICGGVLEHIDLLTRRMRFLDGKQPGWRSRVDSEQRLAHATTSVQFTCDLCGDVATRTGALWTCTKGPETLVHPAGFDICEACFSRHTGCGKKARPLRTRTCLDMSELDSGLQNLLGEKPYPQPGNVKPS